MKWFKRIKQFYNQLSLLIYNLLVYKYLKHVENQKISAMKNIFTSSITLILLLMLYTSACAQEANRSRIIIEPADIQLNVDDEITLNATVYDDRGEATQDTVVFYSRNRRSVSVTPSGQVKALQPGTFEIIAQTVAPQDERIREAVTIQVVKPPVTGISFINDNTKIYSNTVVPVKLRIEDEKGFEREMSEVTLSVSNEEVAAIDDFGRLRAKKPGQVTIIATANGIENSWKATIIENPVVDLSVSADVKEVRTGDVVHFSVDPKNSAGDIVEDVPVTYSFNAQPDDNLGQGTSAQIDDNGNFVANKAGFYTIIAKSGSAVEEETIRVDPRNISKEIEVVGHGLVSDVHTSDLWIWEGVDGRDYAITGTWGGNGEAYFWDVTDPSNMQIIDTVTVDARTVNDVKISEDGRIGVISREGASNRKNGFVILDVTDPSNVEVISEYNEGLTGGVHNVFIYENHVFAVNNGRRYDIVDISDPKNPQTVSRFELDTPGHAVHDVWVENGIAYSSNWSDGVVAVDVGSTPEAQSPERHDIGVGAFDNPVKLGSYTYPSGWNHAAFPFKSESTGDFYVIAGDEAFPNGLYVRDRPTIPAGWIHFIKFDGSWDSPDEVARYQIPEAGTHNFWVKGDTLYVAYYNAGLRVVDISGDLMGNLYEQGREIARFVPTHHQGVIPNAAMTWGPQPYKGHIFLSDWNSGLWALKIKEDSEGTD